MFSNIPVLCNLQWIDLQSLSIKKRHLNAILKSCCTVTTMATGIDPAFKMEIESEIVEYFPYDEETTDVVIRVEDKRMHLSRGILMQASPVFRKMLNSNGKEKQAEITLPEKSYEEVVLFLRCISPREFLKLNGKICDQREIIVYFQETFETLQSEKI